MELPKNIVQIGKPDKVHKIFVEDYVVSYIKQLNKACDDKSIGIALYGKFFEEEECKYYFLYGAARIDGLEHRGPYLSQVEKEEIADVGRRYFDGYDFLAWCSVKGEPLEGFFVQVQGKGVEVEGYACFYEKNESMLNYMLLSGQKQNTGSEPPKQAAEKPGRGEWKAADYIKPAEKTVEKRKKEAVKKTEYMKVAVAAVFLVLCVVGVSTLNDYEKLEDIQVAARQVIANMTEQKLPDAEPDDAILGLGTDLQTVNPGAEGDGKDISGNEKDGQAEPAGTQETTVQENEKTDLDGQQQTDGNSQQDEQQGSQQGELQAGENQLAGNQPDAEISQNEEGLEETEPVEDVMADQKTLVSYTVLKGDTLISICTQKYGSLDKLQEICELNGIANADNIQVGQTILLP